MTVGAKIQITDYNAMQSTMSTLMGKNAYGRNGWGQTLNAAAQVVSNAKISSNDWNNLRKDILNAYIHQVGTAGTLVSAGATFNILQGLVNTAVTFTGTITNNQLTVTSTPSATIYVGMSLTGGTTQPLTGTYISGLVSGSPTASGSVWNISNGVASATQTLASQSYSAATRTIVLNTVPSSGQVQAGQRITNYGGLNNVFVVADGRTPNADPSLSLGDIGAFAVNQLPAVTGATGVISTKVITDADRADFAAAANNVSSLNNQIAAATQASTTPSFAKATKQVAWNGTLTHTVTITFAAGSGYSAAQAAAWFFNSGSYITITASQPVSASPLPKDNSWNLLLASLGTIRLGADGTAAIGSSGLFANLASTIGFWQLTTTNAVLVQKVTTNSTYAANDYRISGKIDSTTARSVITLTIEFRDLDAPAFPRIDENVNSSATYPLTSDVELYYASGTAVSVAGYLPTAAQTGP